MIDRWRQLDERDTRAPSGFTRIRTRTYELPTGARMEWDVFGGGRTVGIVAVTDDDRFVMVRQYRPGPDRVLVEIPGGGVERGESVEDAAARELREETGYAGAIELVGSTWYAGTVATEKHITVARRAERVAEPLGDPNEPCETVLLSLAELREHLRGGQLTDVDVVYRALDHLGLL